jgi:pimeloyl-ACP methyl ester carboxylesterase
MNDAIQYALMSADAYELDDSQHLPVELITRDWERQELTKEQKNSMGQYFYAKIFINRAWNKIAVAYRGSVNYDNWKQNRDIYLWNEFVRYDGLANIVVGFAEDYAKDNLEPNYQIILTGHSLGGFMAMAVAVRRHPMRVKAIAFDAPGIRGVKNLPEIDLIPAEVAKLLPQDDRPNIQNIIVQDSVLSVARNFRRDGGVIKEIRSADHQALIDQICDIKSKYHSENTTHGHPYSNTACQVSLHSINNIIEMLRQHKLEIIV